MASKIDTIETLILSLTHEECETLSRKLRSTPEGFSALHFTKGIFYQNDFSEMESPLEIKTDDLAISLINSLSNEEATLFNQQINNNTLLNEALRGIKNEVSADLP